MDGTPPAPSAPAQLFLFHSPEHCQTLSRWQGSLEELCQHRHGSRVLLHLLRPLCSKYMPPQELSLLTLEQRTRRVPASQVLFTIHSRSMLLSAA